MTSDVQRDKWLDTAVSGVRFGPDREEVREELAGHIEDKEADLRRIFPDIPEEEARERALDGMGDPEEVKKELAKVHRPWLGYLWRASQLLLAVTVLLLLPVGPGLDGWFTENRGAWSIGEGLAVLEPARERAEIDGYSISMTGAVRQEAGDGTWEVRADLEMASCRFWALSGQVLCQQTSAVDSLGNLYLSDWRWNRLTKEEIQYPIRKVNGYPQDRTPLCQNLRLWATGVDPEAEWLRLEYDWLGRSFAMTVYLKEAGV